MRFVKRFFSTLVGKVIAFCLVLLVLRMVTSSKSLKLLPQKEFEQQKQDSKQVSDDTPIKLPPTDKASKSKQPKTESKQVEESSERPEPKLPREREKEAVKPEPVTPSIPQVIEIPLDSRLVLTDKENELLTKFDPKDFKRMGETLRLFKKVHSFVWSRPKSRVISSQKDATKILEKLDNMMFSWIKPSYQSTVELRASFKGKGRGIVLCAGNGHVITAYPTLRMIRELHGFDVPFEIFYTGDSDLNAENRKKFESLGNTVARDITKLFDDKILRLGGWAVKSFALLASSFAEAMLIDADVVFFQSPKLLFEGYDFKTYGALFFHDRSLFTQSDETITWFRSIMPTPASAYSQSFRIFNGKTAHEQESGVVLVNKNTNILGLLATCLLNVGETRDYAYDRVFGDKETFWLGFEAIEEQYIFHAPLPGAAGAAKSLSGGEFEICGRQLIHVDAFGIPLWVNGGIAVSKYDPKSDMAPLTHFLSEPGSWTLHAENRACLKRTAPAIEFSAEMQDLIRKSGQMIMGERKYIVQ